MSWTIAKNDGGGQALSAWGIEAITLTRKSFETDELVFVVRRPDALADPQFATGDTITLNDSDGITRFQGTIRTDATLTSSEQEQQTYGAWNAWDDLKTTTYQQNRRLIRSSDFATLDDHPTTAVVLFRNPVHTSGGWTHWNVKQQIKDALDFGIASGLSLAYNLDAVDSVLTPWSECTDIMLAQVLRRCQANMLDLVGWWDYSASPPCLNFLRRPSMETRVIDLTDSTRVSKIDRLRQRNDLVPAGVVFIFLTSITDPATGKAYTKIDVSSAGSTSGPGVIINTIDLSTLENDSSYYTVPPPGGIRHLAGSYFNTLATPWFDGSIVLKAAECPLAWHPGMIVTFTHGRPDWQALGGVIQQVSEDLLTGLTTLRLGPPAMLSAVQFVTLAMQGKILRQDARPATGSIASTADGAVTSALGRQIAQLQTCDGATINVLTV